MRTIEQESDAETLRRWAIYYREENRLLREAYEKAQNILAQDKQVSLGFDDKLARLRYLAFKKGREVGPVVEGRPRREEEEVLIFSRSLVPEVEERQVKDLPVQEIREYLLSEEELKVESERYFGQGSGNCFKELARMEDRSFEITIIERQVVRREIIRKRYKAIKPVIGENGEEKTVIITAQGPEKLLPGAQYSIEFAVATVCDKYMKHLPLERQRRDYERLGFSVGVKTLYNLCWSVGEHLEGVAERIRKEILAQDLACHCDETPWPILDKKAKDGYMWSISNQAGSYYNFEPTRSGKVIDRMLKGFSGVVLSDGYAGYGHLRNIAGITVANCWAHVRRKFFEIEKNYPKECEEIVTLIQKLFEVEKNARSFKELKDLREDHSAAIIDEIMQWIVRTKTRFLPQSAMADAIGYMEKFWEGLTLFLRNERVPLTNNDAERTLRHAVVGRKNYNGSKTIDGADLAARLFTVIESCKRALVDPQSYMAMAVRMNARSEMPLTPLEYAKAARSKQN